MDIRDRWSRVPVISTSTERINPVIHSMNPSNQKNSVSLFERGKTNDIDVEIRLRNWQASLASPVQRQRDQCQ
ncbi:hypothetical protein AMATHDRAFT_66400 [Amanita thiersii Skay4041]|uniref:Uncharacterized protein n=1 Tax=Amanita thiersii Skay4041 TaxID=703135 RepID=A0A2A9NIC0_9AGAR|nr:hypothetical protein AMATHDRAFT_66400 [Amanita thiersii Skay4041]